MSQVGGARSGRVTDKRPWWDTFPWWSLIIVSVLGWMGWQILTNDNYELAWEPSPSVWSTCRNEMSRIEGLINGNSFRRNGFSLRRSVRIDT